ncbi:MAG: aquaporin [Candidatus Methanomethylophilaceae archaeon]|nr:aquaporin [Candidatus Methanomethylophilaceae archaeon]MBR6214039.1 aquaporin [Candidatus Methanomethylophilaceae archaeon]
MESSIKKYIAELIGTAVLVFFGVGAALLADSIAACAIAFGLTVVVMSVTVGRVSGCHLNPAISIAMFLDKKLSSKDLVGYIIFQIIGAIIAGALILYLFSVHMGIDFSDIIDHGTFGANTLDGVDGSIVAGLITEIFLTFIFVLVVFGATAKNGMDKFAGLFIGLALTMVHLVGIGLTGTSVNPARSIGLAVFQPEALGDLWIFIVAPIIGGILAWLVWKKVLCDDDAE